MGATTMLLFTYGLISGCLLCIGGAVILFTALSVQINLDGDER